MNVKHTVLIDEDKMIIEFDDGRKFKLIPIPAFPVLLGVVEFKMITDKKGD